MRRLPSLFVVAPASSALCLSISWAAQTEFPCVVRARDSARSGWARRRSDSCGMNSMKTSADLESQLELVSNFPGEFNRLSPDERPPHTPSWVRSMASTRAVSSRRRCACGPTSRPCRSTCEVDYSSGQAHWRKSSEWILVWQRRNRSTPRGCQRLQIRRRRTRRTCSGGAHPNPSVMDILE